MKSQRLKKLLRWSVRIVVPLVVLLALFILEENVRGRFALARYETELRAEGEKLTLAEFELPKPPNESNGAPALLAVGDELLEGPKRNPLTDFGLQNWRFVEPGRARGLVREENLDDLRPSPYSGTRRRRGDGSTNEVPDAIKKADWLELKTVLETARSSLEKAKIATEQPSLAVAIKYDSFLEVRVPHVNRFQVVANWLAADAFLALHEGRLDDARRSVAALAQIARSFQSDRLSTLQMIGARFGELGLRSTWEALQTNDWNTAALARWQQVWQGNDGLSATVASTEVERVLAVEDWKRITHWPTLKELRGGAWSIGGLPWWDELRETARGLLWRSAFLRQDEQRMLQRWQRALVILRTTRDTRSWTAAHASFKSDFASERQLWRWYDNWRYLLSGALGPGTLEISLRVQMQYETLRQMTLAAIALKRYELDHGHFPETLEGLVPEYLSELPRDYMDGKPLCYRRTDAGSFVLYSVGENGVDDGGDPRPSESNSRARGLWQGRDAVWPLPVYNPETTSSSTNASSTVVQGQSSTQ